MKKRLPMILAVVGVFVIGAAAAFFYTSHSGSQSQKNPPLKVNAAPAPSASGGVQPQQPKAAQPAASTGGQAAAPGKAPETKKTDAAPAGAPQDAPVKPANPFAYEYKEKGKRDPFATLIVKTEPERKKGLTPIENYETMEFKLIAILWSQAGYYAVITLPDGKSYTIREGTKLGLHGGKVYKITRNSIVIREQVRDQRGRVGPKDVTLKLRREEEG